MRPAYSPHAPPTNISKAFFIVLTPIMIGPQSGLETYIDDENVHYEVVPSCSQWNQHPFQQPNVLSCWNGYQTEAYFSIHGHDDVLAWCNEFNLIGMIGREGHLTFLNPFRVWMHKVQTCEIPPPARGEGMRLASRLRRFLLRFVGIVVCLLFCLFTVVAICRRFSCFANQH